MYAIIETGGKQYKVSEGDKIFVEKLNAAEGDTVTFDALLVVDGENVKVGTPYVEGVSVTGKIVRHGKGAKIIVFKYKPKKDYRKKTGHRQPFTEVEIVSLGGKKPVRARKAKSNGEAAEEAVQAAEVETK